MPKDTPTPLEKQIESPRVRGVSSAAREARQAEERPASERTLAIMPGVGDIAKSLGVKMGKQSVPAAEAEEESESDEESEEEESEESTEKEESEESTEEEESSEEESAEEESEEEEEDENLPEEAKQIRDAMQKRIDKLTRSKTELQEQLEEAQQELETARSESGRGAPTPEDPLAHVMSERELTTEIEEARKIKQWALRNRDGAEVEGKDGQTLTYTAEQMAEILANAEATLDAAPRRREWLGQHAQAQAMAKELAPEFFQKGSTEQIILSNALKEVPASVRAWRPDFDLIIIQALVGATVLGQRKGGNKPAAAAPSEKPKASAKPAPPTPGGKVAPKTSTKAVEKQKRDKQLKKVGGGSMRDLAAALADRI